MVDIDSQTEEMCQLVTQLERGKPVGEFRVPVLGDSMVPILLERDILLVTSNQLDKLALGDIIIRWNKTLVTHRIVSISRCGVITKGDARYWPDSNSDPGNIIGKVRLVYRIGRAANMNSLRWKTINRVIGISGWIQVKLAGLVPFSDKDKPAHEWLHRSNHWLGQKLNWITVTLLAGTWLRRNQRGR